MIDSYDLFPSLFLILLNYFELHKDWQIIKHGNYRENKNTSLGVEHRQVLKQKYVEFKISTNNLVKQKQNKLLLILEWRILNKFYVPLEALIKKLRH